MERRAKVELFERIRKEYEFGIGSIKGVATKLGVHRRMVRQALMSAEPPERKPVMRARPVMAPLIAFIDAILEADRAAPRKQRHTAHRIWQRILDERPEHKVAEVTVRQYVRERKAEQGWSMRTTCVPQSYQLGQEGQVDWYEAWAELSGQQVPLQVFSMRSMASGAAVRLSIGRIIAPRSKPSSKPTSTHSISLAVCLDSSHWRFTSEFCSPYEAHEKGGIESEAGYFRRNHWVPLPKARDLEDLNAQLLTACHAEERRQIAGQSRPVGALMIEERTHLLPLAEHGFDLADSSFPRVDGLGCVRVRTNLYSVPLDVGKTVEVRLYPSCVEIWNEGRCLARHERCYERNQQVLDLEHYLDVLERKPGALIGSKPLAAWRHRGLWPESYDRLLAELIDRHGKQSGTRHMIQVLSLIKEHGHRRMRAAVEEALALGCSDVAAIRHLAEAADLVRARSTILELGALSRYERPQPSLNDYDALLAQKVAS